MTEGEEEDSDPGGTSVLRVTCIGYRLGTNEFLEKPAEWRVDEAGKKGLYCFEFQNRISGKTLHGSKEEIA